MNIPLHTRIETRETGIIAVTVYTDPSVCDRHEHVYAWLLGRNLKLANRLVRAIKAGVIVKVTGIGTDVNGKTYVQTGSMILGKYLNADLTRLGF